MRFIMRCLQIVTDPLTKIVTKPVMKFVSRMLTNYTQIVNDPLTN